MTRVSLREDCSLRLRSTSQLALVYGAKGARIEGYWFYNLRLICASMRASYLTPMALCNMLLSSSLPCTSIIRANCTPPPYSASAPPLILDD